MASATRTTRGRPRAGSQQDGGVILFDPNGRAFNASATVAFWKGSRGDSRRNRNWGSVSDASINSMLAGDVSQVRRLSHDACRKSAWASNGLSTFVSNAVGDGIVPRLKTEDDELRRQVNEAWEEFVEESDADGTQNFYGLQALACRSAIEGGETFIRMRNRRSSDGLSIPLQLQVLEAELCDPSYEEVYTTTGGRIQAGIELNAIGQRTAYWMWRQHPGEAITFRNADRVPVPADSVLHVFQPLRPGQLRGIPGLAVCLATIHDLEQYDDAELMRKKTMAMFAGFVHKPLDSSNVLGAGGVEGFDDDDVPLARLEPGTMQELGPGEDITFSSPSDVGQSYAPFMAMQLRQIAAAIGVTYEQLTGDLTGVNYSSIRAGLVEFRRRMSQYQKNVLVFQLCRPIWRRFIEAALLAGRLTVPSTPAGLRDLMRVEWTVTPGWDYVDPEKDVDATLKAIRGGLMTRSQAVHEQGYDAEALDRERQSDDQRADELGLIFDSDPRRTAAPGRSSGASGAPRAGAPIADPQAEAEGPGIRQVFERDAFGVIQAVVEGRIRKVVDRDENGVITGTHIELVSR